MSSVMLMLRSTLALLLLLALSFPRAAAQTSYCDPAAPNSVSAGGAVLTCTGGWGTANAAFLVIDLPNQPGILFGGTQPLDLPFGCGRRCVGGAVVRGYYEIPSGNQLVTYFDMASTGVTYLQFWYRDPSGFSACGSTYNLSNALMP